MLQHVAIIMDGNGRWAKSRGLPRAEGHRRGAESARSVIMACRELGVRYLTLYTFSSENWNRPQDEVSDLMNLFRFYLSKEQNTLHKEGVRIRVIGDRKLLAPDIVERVDNAEHLTKDNTSLDLVIALSYGSRQEISNACKEVAEQIKAGEIEIAAITPEFFANKLYTKDIPDPDLLIRTGGDQRISNFLLWQAAYSEFFFTPTLWPDFDKKEFEAAIAEFQNRERRFGKRNEDADEFAQNLSKVNV